MRGTVAIALATLLTVACGKAAAPPTIAATATVAPPAAPPASTPTRPPTVTPPPSPMPTFTATSLTAPSPGGATAPIAPAGETASPRPTATPIDPAAVNDPHTRDVVRPRASRAAIVRAQVLLDRAHFSPGEIDAGYGDNLRRAIAAFQHARQLRESGDVDDATWTALNADTARVLVPYVLTPADVAGPFVPIPRRMMDKAKLDALPYSSLLEELGEKFHVRPALLGELNPGASIANAGDRILVPNVARSVACIVHEIVVSASDSSLTVIDDNGAVCARYPATTGSRHDPLPIGTWEVKGIGHNPTFHYNPHLFWDAPPGDRATAIRPGPNNPVGVVWIDLSKEHYGIHGTPDPGKIGHTYSHGCIRLTNWDATELASMVQPGTPATLKE